MGKKYTRKQLKRPDEFISFSMKMWELAKNHLPFVLLSIGVAALILGALWTWMYFSDSRAAKTTSEISHAIDIYEQPLIPADSKDPAKPEDGIPRFKDRTEKLKAVDGDLSTIIEKGGTLQVVARAMRGGVRYDAGNYAGAIEDFQRLLDASNDEALRVLALESIGYCHEALQQWDEALVSFQKLPEAGEGAFRIKYHQARIWARQGKVKEAKTQLKQVMEKATTRSLRDQASDQLVMLEKN